jgi:hypothetical protein
MGGPTGVADTAHTVDRVHTENFFQVAQFAGRAAYTKRLIAARDCQTGRVITAVLKPLETLQNDGDSFAVPDIPYDSTHRFILVGREIRLHSDRKIRHPKRYWASLYY